MEYESNAQYENNQVSYSTRQSRSEMDSYSARTCCGMGCLDCVAKRS